jgi:molybdopterin-guanine dinucleotide biosynthesis adapter protein
MSASAVFGLYGSSDFGKTTLLVQLVKRLRQDGLRVATVKRSNKHISMDTKEKDTWRHHQAGAQLVVFSSASETDFLFNATMSSSDISKKIHEFGSYDVVLVEGADDPAIPKIQVGAGKKRENTVLIYEDNIEDILALIRQAMTKGKPSNHLSIVVNGNDIPLTDFPEQIITNTITGILQSLKGVQTVESFTIQLTK